MHICKRLLGVVAMDTLKFPHEESTLEKRADVGNFFLISFSYSFDLNLRCSELLSIRFVLQKRFQCFLNVLFLANLGMKS